MADRADQSWGTRDQDEMESCSDPKRLFFTPYSNHKPRSNVNPLLQASEKAVHTERGTYRNSCPMASGGKESQIEPAPRGNLAPFLNVGVIAEVLS